MLENDSIFDSKGRKDRHEFYEKSKEELILKLKELIQLLKDEETNSRTFEESSKSLSSSKELNEENVERSTLEVSHERIFTVYEGSLEESSFRRIF